MASLQPKTREPLEADTRNLWTRIPEPETREPGTRHTRIAGYEAFSANSGPKVRNRIHMNPVMALRYCLPYGMGNGACVGGLMVAHEPQVQNCVPKTLEIPNPSPQTSNPKRFLMVNVEPETNPGM